jgi:hypothetical protein
MKTLFAALAFATLLPLAATAADDGELWEVTTQMNIPGMPAGMAGMGGGPQRVCTGKDPKEDATRRPDMQKCKVTDMKQTATRLTITMQCPDGTATVDQTYNAARTEYKGTMTMKSRDGDMVMNTAGRKVGACDVAKSRQEREEKSAKMKTQMDAQVAAGQKQQADMQRQQGAMYTKMCDESLAKMDARQFPTQQSMKSMPPEMRGSCDARRPEFCKRFQTEAGFTLAARHQGNLQPAGELCAVQPARLQATLCGNALKNESFDFLSRHCPAEVKQAGAQLCPKAVQKEAWHYVARNCPADSKALFAKSCAGRQYTSLADRKQRSMCTALAQLDDDGSGRAQPPAASAPAEAAKPSAARQAEQAVGKGIDKLRGLFGR